MANFTRFDTSRRLAIGLLMAMAILLSGCNVDTCEIKPYAQCPNADLGDANLYGADLRSANLTDANLDSADLRGADLHNANLKGADLREADLREANLFGANLGRADLRVANLSDATYNTETMWPEGFDPVAAGAVLVE